MNTKNAVLLAKIYNFVTQRLEILRLAALMKFFSVIFELSEGPRNLIKMTSRSGIASLLIESVYWYILNDSSASDTWMRKWQWLKRRRRRQNYGRGIQFIIWLACILQHCGCRHHNMHAHNMCALFFSLNLSHGINRMFG